MIQAEMKHQNESDSHGDSMGKRGELLPGPLHCNKRMIDPGFFGAA